jgi:ribosomal protein L37AE/L43A
MSKGGFVMNQDQKSTKATRTLNQCAQCGDALLAPVWSEYVKERCVRHLWNCESCDYTFETTVYLAAKDSVEHLISDAA